MTINKFQGKTQEEAIAKAKEEFGERAVIMNIREVKPKGLFRAFKNSTFEVTAAMEEKEHFSNAMQAAQMTQSMAKEGKLHDRNCRNRKVTHRQPDRSQHVCHNHRIWYRKMKRKN